MKKLIKEHWFESVLGIIILALLIVVIKTQNESGKVNKQNLDLQTKVYNLPTATEVFNLRSECATLGQKISDSKPSGNYRYSRLQSSHYNPATNRCYVEFSDMGSLEAKGSYSRFLYDGQTKDELAYAFEDKDKGNTGWINIDGPVDKNDTWPMYNPSISNYDSAMIYISKVMKDDWTQ